jgi:hypothetical protein
MADGEDRFPFALLGLLPFLLPEVGLCFDMGHCRQVDQICSIYRCLAMTTVVVSQSWNQCFLGLVALQRPCMYDRLKASITSCFSRHRTSPNGLGKKVV